MAKTKSEMIKSLAKWHVHSREGPLGGGARVSLIKPPRSRGVGGFPLKKMPKYFAIEFGVCHEKALISWIRRFEWKVSWTQVWVIPEILLYRDSG